MAPKYRVRCDFYLLEDNPIHRKIIDAFGDVFSSEGKRSKSQAKKDVIVNSMWAAAIQYEHKNNTDLIAKDSPEDTLTSGAAELSSIEEESVGMIAPHLLEGF